MTPADWDAHLSWRRHCPEPRVFARVFKMLSVVELWVLSVTVGAGLYATYLQKRPGWPALCSRDYMIVFNITSFALALLMVFRTNTAHARWWEVRGRPGPRGPPGGQGAGARARGVLGSTPRRTDAAPLRPAAGARVSGPQRVRPRAAARARPAHPRPPTRSSPSPSRGPPGAHRLWPLAQRGPQHAAHDANVGDRARRRARPVRVHALGRVPHGGGVRVPVPQGQLLVRGRPRAGQGAGGLASPPSKHRRTAHLLCETAAARPRLRFRATPVLFASPPPPD